MSGMKLNKLLCAKQRGFTVIELLIILAIIGILVVVLMPLFDDNPSVTIYEKEWNCLKQEERTYHYPMLVGKITIVQTGRRMECINWVRKSGT